MRIEANEDLSIDEVGGRLRSGEITSVELTTQLLARADSIESRLGVYETRLDEQALEAASHADEEIASGHDRGPLHGIPIGIKDIFVTRDAPTTAHSRVTGPGDGRNEDASVVRRLRDGGAVIMGKTTTMEFALGIPDIDDPFPLPRNPWDVDRWPGGSSSGTAAGVASQLFLGGLGTDTGGSIRVPAAFTGVCGLKPTFGLVPTGGCIPLAQSLDHVGPIASSARDCALMLHVIAATATVDDGTDRGSSRSRSPSLEQPNIRGLRVGVDRHHQPLRPGEEGAGASFDEAIEVLRELGGHIVEIELPNYDSVAAATTLTLVAEATSHHLDALRSRWDEFGRMTRIALARGPLVSATVYLAAQQIRQLTRNALESLFERVDVIISPAAVCTPPRVDRLQTFMPEMFDRVFTSYWNGVGNPALVVPMGFDDDAMPVGLQIAAAHFDEHQVISVGEAFQASTAWHQARPLPPGRSHIGLAPQSEPRFSESAAVVTELLERAGLRPPADDIARLADQFDRLQDLAEVLDRTDRSGADA